LIESCINQQTPYQLTIVKRPIQATLHHIQRKLNSRKVLVFLENINDLVGCCYPFFGSYKKIRKYKKQYQKIFKRNPKNNRSEKKSWNAEKITKLVEEVQKYKMLKFDNRFLTDESPVDKENSS